MRLRRTKLEANLRRACHTMHVLVPLASARLFVYFVGERSGVTRYENEFIGAVLLTLIYIATQALRWKSVVVSVARPKNQTVTRMKNHCARS